MPIITEVKASAKVFLRAVYHRKAPAWIVGSAEGPELFENLGLPSPPPVPLSAPTPENKFRLRLI